MGRQQYALFATQAVRPQQKRPVDYQQSEEGEKRKSYRKPKQERLRSDVRREWKQAKKDEVETVEDVPQNLLRKLDDNFSKYGSQQVTTIIYSVVRLRLPDDTLLKKCIEFITNEIKNFNSKETSLSLWALAKMSYPSKHLQMIMLKKIKYQLDICLKDESMFDSSLKQENDESKEQSDVEDVEEPAPDEVLSSMDNGQTIALYYWGLSKLGVFGDDPVYESLDALISKYPKHFTLQQYGIILYSLASTLNKIPSPIIRESLQQQT